MQYQRTRIVSFVSGAVLGRKPEGVMDMFGYGIHV